MYRTGALSVDDENAYSSLSDSDSEIMQLGGLSLDEPGYQEVSCAAWDLLQPAQP